MAIFAFGSSSTLASESSPHVPQKGTLPSTTTMIWSTRFKKWEACVTRTTAALDNNVFSHCLNNLSKTNRAVPASSALRGSSKRAMSGLEYTTRANETRCFCPPERVTPRSPISVWSPDDSCSMSVRKQQASNTWLYRSASNSFPNNILLRSVALRMNATWLA
mmetsp:Transcript_18893/g.40883  ORF Transcript_18893/g.40883 Transcript_18893/m.40883 type:complete len:163 (+) Transcript_18893:2171-2659(+)